jgi:hypothetical protein
MKVFSLNSKENKQFALRALMAVMGADGMEMVLRKSVVDGTREQEIFFNILCGIIANENGEDVESIKYYIKERVFGRVISEVMGITIEFVPRSNYQGMAGYSKLIEASYRLGAELGIILPEPRKNNRGD